MNRYWDEVVDVAKALAWFVKKLDKDGLELYTTVPDDQNKTRYHGIKKSTDFENIAMGLRRNKPSDITDTLGDILHEYATKLKNEYRKRDWARRAPSSFRKVQPKTIYIFTDAVWTPDSDPTKIILEIVHTLQQNSQYGSTQLGIQFIQWGHDPMGTMRLKRLDILKSFEPEIFGP